MEPNQPTLSTTTFPSHESIDDYSNQNARPPIISNSRPIPSSFTAPSEALPHSSSSASCYTPDPNSPPPSPSPHSSYNPPHDEASHESIFTRKPFVFSVYILNMRYLQKKHLHRLSRQTKKYLSGLFHSRVQLSVASPNDTTRVQQSKSPARLFALIGVALLLCLSLLIFFQLFLNCCMPFRSSTIDTTPAPLPRHVDVLQQIYPTDGFKQTTAILLNWNRLENLKTIVNHLCRYPEIWKEIMIWNNNQKVFLTKDVFGKLRPSCPPLNIYNSPGNMQFIARYMACSMASTPYCYFQDDDWMVKPLRSMYANFLRFPHLVHADTNAHVYALTNWKWCFFDDSISLHTCFSWVGTGAFVSRENVVRFLMLASVTEMDPVEFAYGDMYFTTYMNQVPYQLENYLTDLPQEFAFSAGEEGIMRNQIYMHKAVGRLIKHLRSDADDFQREEMYPRLYDRDVRSPCHTDRCLFLTNKHSFPDTRVFTYNSSVNITESEMLHENFYDTQFFIYHPYSNAVDELDHTAWRSGEKIRAGEYFGLDLMVVLHDELIDGTAGDVATATSYSIPSSSSSSFSSTPFTDVQNRSPTDDLQLRPGRMWLGTEDNDVTGWTHDKAFPYNYLPGSGVRYGSGEGIGGVNYRVLVDMPREFFAGVKVEISEDGTTWTRLHPTPKFSFRLVPTALTTSLSDKDPRNPHRTTNRNHTRNAKENVVDEKKRTKSERLDSEHEEFEDDAHGHLLACSFRIPQTGYRFIRLMSVQDQPYPFVLHDLSFHGRTVQRDDWEGCAYG